MTTGSTTGFQSRYRFFKSHVPARRPMRSSARSNRPARSSFSPPYLRDHAPIFELNCKKRPSIQLLRSAGIEPTTVRLEGGCSIQLSYERATTILSHHGEIRKAMIPQSKLRHCRQSQSVPDTDAPLRNDPIKFPAAAGWDLPGIPLCAPGSLRPAGHQSGGDHTTVPHTSWDG